jgi:hypothetical protein
MRLFRALALVTVSCGGLVSSSGPDASTDAAADCSISASAFDTTCTTSSDCQLAWFGDVCDPVCAQCVPNSAINVSSIPAYEAAFATLLPDSGPGCFCPRAFVVPTCNHGTCEATEAGDD